MYVCMYMWRKLFRAGLLIKIRHLSRASLRDLQVFSTVLENTFLALSARLSGQLHRMTREPIL